MNANLDTVGLGQASETGANYTKNATIATVATTARTSATSVNNQDTVLISTEWSDIFESTLDVSKGSMVISYNHDTFLNHKARKEIEAILNG
jgi:hypothetical protein